MAVWLSPNTLADSLSKSNLISPCQALTLTRQSDSLLEMMRSWRRTLLHSSNLQCCIPRSGENEESEYSTKVFNLPKIWITTSSQPMLKHLQTLQLREKLPGSCNVDLRLLKKTSSTTWWIFCMCIDKSAQLRVRHLSLYCLKIWNYCPCIPWLLWKLLVSSYCRDANLMRR